MANQTTQQRFHAFCDGFKYFRIDELELDEENTIVNMKSLVPTCHDIWAGGDSATIHHFGKTTGVFIHSDGFVIEHLNDNYFSLHTYKNFKTAFVQSTAIYRIFLDLFLYVEGCTESQFNKTFER